MLESSRQLQQAIGDLLALVRSEGEGRYACIIEPSGILFEDPRPEGPESQALHTLVETQCGRLFRIPEEMASGGPESDVFSGWGEDEFLLAVVNGKVALMVACPDAEALRGRLERPLRVLVDRLLRWKSAYRLDRKGRGLFLTAPQLDIVVVGRQSD